MRQRTYQVAVSQDHNALAVSYNATGELEFFASWEQFFIRMGHSRSLAWIEFLFFPYMSHNIELEIRPVCVLLDHRLAPIHIDQFRFKLHTYNAKRRKTATFGRVNQASVRRRSWSYRTSNPKTQNERKQFLVMAEEFQSRSLHVPSRRKKLASSWDEKPRKARTDWKGNRKHQWHSA